VAEVTIHAQPIGAALKRAFAALRDVCVGATGTNAYEAYVAHLRAHHPYTSPPSRAQFARQELDDRWNGIRRCC
jgi:uncharacterized short protein YbdD (DUF466 family)